MHAARNGHISISSPACAVAALERDKSTACKFFAGYAMRAAANRSAMALSAPHDSCSPLILSTVMHEIVCSFARAHLRAPTAYA